MLELDEDEEVGFFRRHRAWLIVAMVGLVGGGVALWKKGKGDGPAPRAEQRITMLTLPPPPPKPIPTPPPVQQPPPPDQKVVEKKEMVDETPKAEAPKPEPVKAPDEPPPSMGSNIKGNGPDGFGLSGSGNGGFIGRGGNGGGGSPFARYASQIQNRTAEALRQDKRTKSAAFDAKLRLWIDESGKVTRSEPVGGDSTASSAAAALLGVRMFDRLPDGMPMPITVHAGGRRPN